MEKQTEKENTRKKKTDREAGRGDRETEEERERETERVRVWVSNNSVHSESAEQSAVYDDIVTNVRVPSVLSDRGLNSSWSTSSNTTSLHSHILHTVKQAKQHINWQTDVRYKYLLASHHETIEGLRERTKYVPQLWNWENHSWKPVTWQNISSCSVLLPEIVMQDAFNVILWTSADICVVHDDLGWKNRISCYCRFSAMSLALRVIFSGGTTEQHVIIGFGELAAVD